MSETLQFGHSMVPPHCRQNTAVARPRRFNRISDCWPASNRFEIAFFNAPLRMTSGPCSAYSWRMSTMETDASGRSCTRRSMTTTCVPRVGGVVAAFERWRGRTQYDKSARVSASNHRHVTPVVPRSFLLLERAVVLFVDDDQSELVQRRKHSRARADHDRHLAAPDAKPLVRTLTVGQSAVLHGNSIAKRIAKRPGNSGRQGDLGDEHEHRSAAAQHAIGKSKIHLCLAGARDSLQQKYRESTGRRRRPQSIKRPRLLLCQDSIVRNRRH